MWRYFLISLAITIVSAVAVFRLFQTTVIKADRWNEKAMESFGDVIPSIPERGKILADDGSILAANVVFYDAKIDWKSEAIKRDTFYKYLPALCDSLAVFFPGRMTAKQWQKEFKGKYNDAINNPKARGLRNYSLASNLSQSRRDRLRSFPFFNKGRAASGLVFTEQLRRCKPYGSIASRSIGSVHADKLALGDNRHDEQVVMHGVSGLEMSLDSLLYGREGEMQSVQSTVRTLRWEHVPAVNGYDIMTSINIGIQDIVEQELYDMCLEAEPMWCSAVVMDVETGEIKAVSNFERRDTFDVSKGYVEVTNHAFLRYETGSVMKVISMLVALEDGIVDNVNERIPTGRSWAYSGGRPITDAHAATDMSITDVIAQSSNIGIAKIITSKYGSNPVAFRNRLKELGFFEPLNTGIAGAHTPMMWFEGHPNSDRIALSRMAYGYGMSTPPIYTLAIYNAIAGGGRFVRPRLVKQLMHDGVADSVVKVNYVRERICSEENARKLREMMHAVVHDPHGTGKSLRNSVIDFAGKTGTAYVTINGRYTSMKRYSFCGFFPYDKPKYSCIVVFERGKYGAARSSGRVFREIAMKMHARGMLDNRKEYTAGTDSLGGKHGMMYATATSGRHTARSFVDVEAASTLGQLRRPGKVAADEVPDVIGLGIRDAIDVLEGAGLIVKFSGTGYVYRQSLQPGSKLIKGAEIQLALRN